MAGVLGHARSRLALPDARHARSAGASQWAINGVLADLSAAVGAIPGADGRTNGPGGSAGGPLASTSAVAAKPLPSSSGSRARPLSRLLQPDMLVVARQSLPVALVRALRRLGGVAAAVSVDAGRVQVNGVFVNVLGVNPATFRPFAASPTARSTGLWQNVSAGGMAISYTMGHQDRLTLTKPVRVTGSRTLTLPVAGFGTVGIGGVDAVVSDAVARTLGLPAGNAVVISAPKARLDRLMARIKKLAPAGTAVAPLVTVQWSMAQAGVLMPRVAADQARTGPLLRLSDLRPGDLLFYHTDPTAPNYISHVAIYIGNGQMLQAPEPGMDVEVVVADFGAGFAGAVRVYPGVAAAVAGNLAG